MSVFECELVFVCVREYLRVFASAHRVMEASAGYKREGILSFQSITITLSPPQPTTRTASGPPPLRGGGAPGPP